LNACSRTRVGAGNGENFTDCLHEPES
jgi:hypothetical protein